MKLQQNDYRILNLKYPFTVELLLNHFEQCKTENCELKTVNFKLLSWTVALHILILTLFLYRWRG